MHSSRKPVIAALQSLPQTLSGQLPPVRMTAILIITKMWSSWIGSKISSVYHPWSRSEPDATESEATLPVRLGHRRLKIGSITGKITSHPLRLRRFFMIYLRTVCASYQRWNEVLHRMFIGWCLKHPLHRYVKCVNYGRDLLNVSDTRRVAQDLDLRVQNPFHDGRLNVAAASQNPPQSRPRVQRK